METQQHEEIIFTREQFYEKVWSAPTTKIAKELGCSDVMVGKVCKSYHIPKPYLGYWAKLSHGKNPKKIALPKNSDPAVQTLIFRKYPHQEKTISIPEPEPEYDLDIQQMLDKTRSLGPIRVPVSLRNPHPLVAVTRDQIRINQIPFYKRSYTEKHQPRPTLSVDVSKEASTRALRIMDALIKRIEKIGGSVEIIKKRWTRQTVVRFGNEEVSVLRLREKQNQIRVSPEKRLGYLDSRIELQPSGLLILDQGSSYFNSILLRDTPKRRRIEDGLNDLTIKFVKWAGDLRIRRRQEEEDRKKREKQEKIRRQKEEERRRQREELAQRQKAEQARVDELVHHANSWRQSQIIREYLDSICDMLFQRDGMIAVDGEAAEYLRWAHQQADRIDPLRPSPPSVLDEKI